MTTVTAVPLNYIVFNAGYTERIPQMKDKLLELLDYHYPRAKPLYINHNAQKAGIVFLTDESTTYRLPKVVNELELAIDSMAKTSERSTITFSATSFAQIFSLKRVLDDLNYCNMCSVEDIQFMETTILGEKVKFAYVTIDSESG